MTDVKIGGLKPCLTKFSKAGDSVLWCRCGRSLRQPFCDGSHKGTGLLPLRVFAKNDNEEALLCACKRTKSPPYCDGAHNALGDDYESESEAEFDWSAVTTSTRSHGAFGRADLDGGCYVLTPSLDNSAVSGGWRILSTIAPSYGADRLSQYLLVPTSDHAERLNFASAEIVLFVAGGEAEIDVSGRIFDAPEHSAISIRPGEAFLARPRSPIPTLIVATVCPPEALSAGVTGHFDVAFPERGQHANATARNSMGNRYYQVLTSEATGACEITQFIGGIPRSRAAVHRHLYEETLFILAGEGVMWTETRKAPVKPGDIIYLPRKQLHSLECDSSDGMMLAGSFFPAGSPAINY